MGEEVWEIVLGLSAGNGSAGLMTGSKTTWEVVWMTSVEVLTGMGRAGSS